MGKKRLSEAQKLLENLRDVEIAPLKARWDAERAKADEHKDAQEKLERLKAKAAAARRQGDYERLADLEYGAIPELEKKLQQLAENAMDVDSDDRMVSDVVTVDDVAAVVARWTGVPVSKLAESERSKLLALAHRLKERVVGQDKALEDVSAAIVRARAGLARPDAPLGSFLFCGPTGVGKTETAKALASELFDDPKHALVRLDMSEYSEAHSVSRLVGAPPRLARARRGLHAMCRHHDEQRRRDGRPPERVASFVPARVFEPTVLRLLVYVSEQG